MLESNESRDMPAEGAPPEDFPRGAYESLLIVALISFVGVCVCIFAFGYWGESVVDGLENAASEAMFRAAQKLQEEGHASLAIQRYRIAFEGEFQDEETRYMCGRALGDLLREQGRYDEALQAYRRLPEASFSFSGAYTGFVDLLFKEGFLEEAEEKARVWLALAEQEGAQNQVEWANATLANIALEHDDMDAALVHSRAAVEANPKSSLGLTLARLLYARGEVDAAKAQLERFLEVTEDAQLRLDARALQESWPAS